MEIIENLACKELIGIERPASMIQYIMLHSMCDDRDNTIKGPEYFQTNVSGSVHYLLTKDRAYQIVPDLNIAYGCKRVDDNPIRNSNTLHIMIDTDSCENENELKQLIQNIGIFCGGLTLKYNIPVSPYHIIRHFDIEKTTDCPKIFKTSSIWNDFLSAAGSVEINQIKEEFLENMKKIFGEDILNNTVTISETQNQNHEAVRYICTYLQRFGYYEPENITYTFNEAMTKAVKKFQSWMTNPNGVITAKKSTWKKLLDL